MIVLGLILLAAVAVVVIAAVASGDEPATLGLVGADLDTSVRWVFITGAVSVVVLVISLALLRAGLRRARARRHEIKELKAAATPSGRSADEHRAPSRRPVGPHDPDEQTHFDSTPRE